MDRESFWFTYREFAFTVATVYGITRRVKEEKLLSRPFSRLFNDLAGSYPLVKALLSRLLTLTGRRILEYNAGYKDFNTLHLGIAAQEPF